MKCPFEMLIGVGTREVVDERDVRMVADGEEDIGFDIVLSVRE